MMKTEYTEIGGFLQREGTEEVHISEFIAKPRRKLKRS